MNSFLNYGLDEKILKALEELEYKEPTEIQNLAIPAVLAKSDVVASARTGTGKTAAFMLPVLHRLATESPAGKGPHVLVLVPTRELATQVATEAKKFSAHMQHLKTACIYGGVPYPPQKRMLSKRCDIIVATPGRLIDHMDSGLIDLSQLKVLILDEADRMLDMGFMDSIERIAEEANPERQTLLFSATIDKRVISVTKKLVKDPVEIKAQATEIQKSAIEQQLFYVDNIGHKTRLLDHILENTRIYQSILFTSTKRLADELADELKQKGYASCALHGDMNQRQRNRTIDRLRSGEVHVLVATDVAARGIDVSTITHVINFDLPRNPEDFVHRIGRTGRAGATGVAITFATYGEQPWIGKINKLMGTEMTVQTIEGMEPKARSKAPRQDFNPRSRFGNNQSRSRFGDNKPRSNYGDDKPRSDYADEKPRSDYSEERPRSRFNDDKPRSRFGDNKPRSSYGDDKPRRFNDDKPRRFNDDKPRRFNDDKPRSRFGDDKPRSSYGDNKPRSRFNDSKSKPRFERNPKA